MTLEEFWPRVRALPNGTFWIVPDSSGRIRARAPGRLNCVIERVWLEDTGRYERFEIAGQRLGLNLRDIAIIASAADSIDAPHRAELEEACGLRELPELPLRIPKLVATPEEVKAEEAEPELVSQCAIPPH
jgi:hypothetical protein